MYVFQLFDTYSGSGSVLLVVVICESLAMGWLYGEPEKTVTSYFTYRKRRMFLLSITSLYHKPSPHWPFLGSFSRKDED